MVAGGDPRQGRVIGRYLRDQHILPRLWEVEVVAGEHCVNGGPCSGGRRFGQSWTASERAVKIKLEWGLDSKLPERVADEVRAPETASPE